MLIEDEPDDTPIRPIRYWYRTLHKLELNYDATHREWYAVGCVMLKLRPYPEGVSFTVRTEQDVLGWILNRSDASEEVQQLRVCFYEFAIDIIRRPGIKHQAADALSCMPTYDLDTSAVDDKIPTILAVPAYIEMATREYEEPQQLSFE